MANLIAELMIGFLGQSSSLNDIYIDFTIDIGNCCIFVRPVTQTVIR